MPIIDWLQYTVKEYYTENDKAQVINRAFDTLPEFLQDDIMSYFDENNPYITVDEYSGINMYTKSFTFKNGIRVCYAPIKKEMGFNVIISGSVLNEKEYSINELKEWHESNKDIIKLTRIDYAYDTNIDFSYFNEKFNKKEFLTKLRDFRKTVDQNNRGTLYFGKREGNLMVRIYDKKQEKIDNFKGTKAEKAKFIGTLPETWTRIEYQFRHNHAEQSFYYYLCNKINSVCLGHFKYIKPCKTNNVSRDCEVDEIYQKIINAKECIRLKNQRNKTFNRQYFITNVLAQYKAVEKYNREFLLDCMSEAEISENTFEKLKNDELYIQREKRIKQNNNRKII